MQAQYRIACLRIAKFQIGVHRKDDPALRGKPLVILSGKGNRAHVVMSSVEAERQQVFAGMKLSEAQAACADLVWRDYDEHLYNQAHQRLCNDMISCSPKVSVIEPGMFVLDASGLNYLGGEKKFCASLTKVAARAGYPAAQIGIADSTFAAIVASKCKKRRCFIVEAGCDAEFLSPLSVKHLPIGPDMLESLYELGIRTIGQMTSLSQESLMERFGREGIVACELARGIDSRRPALPPAQKEFKCFVDLGSAIELLNEVQFVLKSMSDRLMAQMRDEGLCAEELVLTFYNDDELVNQRPIRLLRPSNHSKFLLEVMKLSLEATPLQREITAIDLNVTRFSKESWHQLPTEPKEDEEQSSDFETLSLTMMLQRFLFRLGEDAVVKPIPNDQHIPEQAAAWLPVSGKHSVTPVVPVNVSYVNAYVGPSGLASGLALRKFPSPMPVLVEFGGAAPINDDDVQQPQSIAFEGRWYRIIEITVPERLSGLWWDQPVRRSYYVALIQPKELSAAQGGFSSHQGVEPLLSATTSMLVLLVHDHELNSWYLSGTYD